MYNEKISIINHLGSYVKDGVQTPINPKVGQPMKQMGFKEFLDYTTTLNKNTPKHFDGCFFRYPSNVMGKPNEADGICMENIDVTSEIIFVDFDGLSYDDAELIYNSFEELASKMSCLMAVQKSSSYYSPKPDHGYGLHIFAASPPYNEENCEFISKNFVCFLCENIKRICGIQLIDNADSSLNSFWHRFFIHYGEFKYNPYYTQFSMKSLSDDVIDYLSTNYQSFRKTKITYTSSNVILDPSAIVMVPDDVIPMNRNQRFRVAAYIASRYPNNYEVFRLFFSKIWREKHKEVVSDNKKELEQLFRNAQRQARQYADSGYRILDSVGLIHSLDIKDNKDIMLGPNEYMTDKIDDIVEFIQSNKRCSITAPTGTGKTSLINNGLAQKLNAVVIVPYNSVNKLYDNLYEISTTNDTNNQPIPTNQPVTLVIDQASKHFEEIRERQIIIDESHVLFMDREFRTKAIELMNMLKADDSVRVCCVSATPAGEIDFLQCNNMMKFSKRRTSINLKLVETNNPDYCVMNNVKCKYYDRIVLLSDEYAKKVYENIWTNPDVAYIRADTKNSDDYKNMLNTEKLSKKITICTRVAFNGLNFKNVGEKVLVIVTFRPGDTIPGEIIQSMGRIRNSKCDVKVIMLPAREEENITERREKSVTYNDISTMIDERTICGLYDKNLLDDDYYEANRMIEQYKKQNSTKEQLIKSLGSLGYVCISEKIEDITDEDGDDVKGKMQLKLKRMVSDDMYNDLKNTGEFDVNKCDGDDVASRYYRKWRYHFKNISDKYDGVTIDTVIEMKDRNDKKLLMETVLDKIDRICMVLSIGDDAWDNYLARIESVKLILSGKQIDYKKFESQCNENIRIRNKYYGKFRDRGGMGIDDVFDAVLMDMEKMNKETKVKNAENGSKGGKTGRRVRYQGTEYDTIRDLADAIGKPESTIYNWIKKNKVQYV